MQRHEDAKAQVLREDVVIDEEGTDHDRKKIGPVTAFHSDRDIARSRDEFRRFDEVRI